MGGFRQDLPNEIWATARTARGFNVGFARASGRNHPLNHPSESQEGSIFPVIPLPGPTVMAEMAHL